MALSVEQAKLQAPILAEILELTDLRFEQIDSIDTRIRDIANAVLPILMQWPAKLTEENLRHAIYARFHTPHARKFINQVISWWSTEEYEIAVASLTQTVALLATADDATGLWELYRSRPIRPFHYLLLAKLASTPSPVASEVRNVLIQDLREKQLTPGDLQEISQVDDARITKWFEGQLSSSNSYVRQIAKKKLSKKRKLPRGIRLSSEEPDRAHEVFSAEVDLLDLASALDQIQKQFCLTVPKHIRNARFLFSLEVGQWAAITILAAEQSFDLWFRVEDVDALEIVVTALERGTTIRLSC